MGNMREVGDGRQTWACQQSYEVEVTKLFKRGLSVLFVIARYLANGGRTGNCAQFMRSSVLHTAIDVGGLWTQNGGQDSQGSMER